MRDRLRRGLALCLVVAAWMTAVPAALAAEGKVNTSSLNLRKAASQNSDKLQTLDRGDKLDVISESGDWYKVRYGKYTGYVMKKYVKVSGSVKKTDAGAKTETQKETADKTETGATLRKGSSGSAVKKLQQRLRELGYYTGSADGKYDSGVVTAVKNFQKKNGLTSDGVAGSATQKKLYSAKAVSAKTEAKKETSSYKTESYSWFKNPNKIPKGAVFTVKDCKTGKTFQVKRWSGSNHLDAEPLTTKDSAVMKSVYGGAWSWRRRPILVKYNGHVYAASMNGMPHGTDTISGNNFDGHFCIHFSGSKTHETNRVDADHQNAVKTAMKYTW